MVKTYTEVFQNRPVELRFETIGRDLMVICSGGDRAHIGSLSLAQPYREGTCASVSNLSLVGHRDSSLGNEIAYRIAKMIGKNTAVLCGIHFDQISPEEIQRLCALVLKVCAAFCEENENA